MAEKVLPPYPLNLIKINDRIVVRTRDEGTLLYVKDNTLSRVNVEASDIIEV